MFGKKTQTTTSSGRIEDFAYLSDKDIYMDTACQSLRPQIVIDELNKYFVEHNACGGRVKYAWGQKVDNAIADTRGKVLKLLKLSDKDYSVSFTLNTTYGINLILSQLKGPYSKVITSEIEHNSVFLPTIELAKRLGTPRVVLDRQADGNIVYDKSELKDAVVVVNAVSNIDGRQLGNLKQLIDDVHSSGGIIVIDAAQAMAHHYDRLAGLQADAIAFSAHKMYAPSLGVVVVRRSLLDQLQIGLIGGGMVYDVKKDSYQLLPDDQSSWLEPGLQNFGAILALGTAIDWLLSVKPFGKTPKQHIADLSTKLYEGLESINGINILNDSPQAVISFYSDKQDAHRLAIFLSAAGIMARSGTFCCHYYLNEKLKSPPLLRLSLGLHNTDADIDKVISTIKTVQKG